MGYDCLWDFAAFSQLIRHGRLISGFCSSGYDFAIPSSRLHLTMQTLGVAMGFVGNYAPCGLSPQTDGMPVIRTKAAGFKACRLRLERIHHITKGKELSKEEIEYVVNVIMLWIIRNINK